MNRKTTLCFILACIFSVSAFNQEKRDPFSALPSPLLGKEMPAFSLMSHADTLVSLENLEDKNVMIFFLRGLADFQRWCQICHYQYADMVRLEKMTNLRKNTNTEIVFVLPYSIDSIKMWTQAFPEQFEVIKSWKYPDMNNASHGQKDWAEIASYIMPQDLWNDQTQPALLFPVLSDPNGEYAKKLGLRTTNWGGRALLQNIPTVFILDKDQKICFKYHSQNLYDRPTSEMFVRFLESQIGR